jgi:RNA polymerase sigma-70 factor (ECF subfamily)
LRDETNTEEEIRNIYQLHYKAVYRFIVSFTKTQDEAEDLTQEVFIRSFKSFSNFKRKSNVKTWLFSIARNVAIDYSRKAKRKLIFNEVLLKMIPSKQKSTEDVIEIKEQVGDVFSTVKNLKNEYRMVILLRAVNDFSIKETADIMGWSESKVKVSYHRALKQLKTHLETDETESNGRWLLENE